MWIWQLPRKSTQNVRSHFSCPFGLSHGWLNGCFHLALKVPAGSLTVLTQSLQKKLLLWETWLSVSRCRSVEAASTCSLRPSAWSENWSHAIRSCTCCNFWPVTVNYLFISPVRVSTRPSTEKFVPFKRDNPTSSTRKKNPCEILNSKNIWKRVLLMETMGGNSIQWVYHSSVWFSVENFSEEVQ